jgi:hypothetical protein
MLFIDLQLDYYITNNFCTKNIFTVLISAFQAEQFLFKINIVKLNLNLIFIQFEITNRLLFKLETNINLLRLLYLKSFDSHMDYYQTLKKLFIYYRIHYLSLYRNKIHIQKLKTC